MDPVSALGLVANIFAVIAFSKDVVDVACQIRDAGDSDQLSDLEAAAANLLSAIERLSVNPEVSDLKRESSQEDVAILQIAQEITRTSQKIATFLDKVRRGKGQSRPSMLQTTLQTVRTIWNRKTTDGLRNELSRVEQSLHLHATLSVKVKLEKDAIQLNDVLTTLDTQTKDLLTSKSFLANLNPLKTHCEEIKENQARGDRLAKDRHHEIITSLDAVRVRLGSPMLTSKEWSVDEKQADLVLDQILSSLWFPLISDREEGIPNPHAETFEWVFRDPTQSEKPWDSFNTFLQNDSLGTYWVSGKPGAGKSTLMKFISRHPTTKHLLQTWAGGDDFVIASFFFHYLGSDLQKSEVGAFSCLLYQILSHRRDLVRVAFPERFRALSLPEYQPGRFKPSIMELKRALNTIIQNAPSTHLFLLVDGLDEYHANSADTEFLATTLRSLSTFPNVKLLVSSRPWIVFDRAFAGCPGLRVHDLTRPDIARFVSEGFREHQRLLDLMPRDEGVIKNLIAEIVDASYGVFLWVRLAVHSVLEGLRNCDSIESLQDRFRELPPDLEDLYRHIWDRIPHRYRVQAARYLLLVERNSQLRWGRGELDLRSMAFAETYDPELIYSTAVGPLEEAAIGSMLEKMQGRLRSRCMGLLEVRESAAPKAPEHLTHCSSEEAYRNWVLHDFWDKSPDTVDQSHGYPCVFFIHRTVQEFLSSPNHRPAITESAADSNLPFHPAKGLLCSALMRLKTNDWGSGVPNHPPVVIRRFSRCLEVVVDRCLFFARDFEQAAGYPATRILVELDKTMLHLHQTLLFPPPPSAQHWTSALKQFPPTFCGDLVEGPETCDFLSLCVYYDLGLFAKEMIATSILNSTFTKRKATSLLGYTMAAGSDGYRTIMVPLNTMQVVLENGADPNERYRCTGTALWHACMSPSESFCWNERARLEVIKLLLFHGADPVVNPGPGSELPMVFSCEARQPKDLVKWGKDKLPQMAWSFREALEEYMRFWRYSDVDLSSVQRPSSQVDVSAVLQLLDTILQILNRVETEVMTRGGNEVGILSPRGIEDTTAHGGITTEGGHLAPTMTFGKENGDSEGLGESGEGHPECREDDEEGVMMVAESRGQEATDQDESIISRGSKADRRSMSLRKLLCCLV